MQPEPQRNTNGTFLKGCNGRFGKPHTSEVLKKMSLEKLGKPRIGYKPGEGIANMWRSYYKNNARKRYIPWEISDEFFDALIKNNCHYCGKPPISFTKRGMSGELICNGVDRLNNSLGYFELNVVACCALCNRLKSDMSYIDYISHIRKSALHLRGLV